MRRDAGQGDVAEGDRKEPGKAFSARSLHGRIDEIGGVVAIDD